MQANDLEGYPLMQRFTLLHDGSNYGWQAAYLAFHLSARLGAPLLVLLVDSAIDSEIIVQRTNQVEVGGRAAGVVISTRLVTDFSVEVVAENAAGSDALFVPRQLILDGKHAARFLEALSCPLWIVLEESEIRNMAVVVNNAAADKGLIDYTTTLSHRLQESLIGLAREDAVASMRYLYAFLPWHPLPDFSPAKIAATLDQLDNDTLFLPVSGISLIYELPINCVVYPA
jgi:hypothetical protein